MKKDMNRRELFTKVAIAAGTLAAFKGVAFEPINIRESLAVAGSWLYQGQPCAIFQQGPVLLIVNEVGSLATGQVTGPNTFVILGGSGWDIGLTGEVVNRGRTINWSNNTVWTWSRGRSI